MVVNSNNVVLVGTIASEPKQFRNKTNIVSFEIDIERISGITDRIIVAADRSKLIGVTVGQRIYIEGALCTYNENGHLKIYVFAYEVNKEQLAGIDDVNSVCFDGFVCKYPKYRETPKGRIITDIIVAINHKQCTSYIPVLAWGRNANKSAFLEVGTHIQCSGRIQSRTYTKVTEDGTEDRVAYEVSSSAIEVVERRDYE